MKVAAIILNFFFPGVGSLIIGQVGQGIVQLILYVLGAIFTVTVLGAIIGIPMMLAAWIWGLVTAATYDEKPVEVHHHHHGAPTPPNASGQSLPSASPETTQTPPQ